MKSVVSNSVVSFEPVVLAAPHGEEAGRLVFRGHRLMAILVEDIDHDRGTEGAGRWRVRTGFGPCADPPHEGFATLQEVSVWVSGLVHRDGGVPPRTA